MADTGIFCTQAMMLQYAGAGVATALTAAVDTTFAYSNNFIRRAESYINTVCKYNFSDNYASLNVDVKYILEEAAACHAAMSCINYDMSGYTSRAEAQTMLNILYDKMIKCIKELESKDKQSFITGA